MTHMRLYRNGVLESESFPTAEISQHLLEPDAVVWLDFCSPTEDELRPLAEEFGLHRLAIEDALHAHQRPKLDRYGTHLFLTAYAVHLDDETGELTTTEVDAFISRHWLITVRKNEGFPIEPVLQRWDESNDLAKHGVSFLLYGLLDTVVDGHFDTVRRLDDFTEGLEDLLFVEPPESRRLQRRSFQMRKSLFELRRVVLPMREELNGLMRREHGFIDNEMYEYYQDVYDHVLRVTEWTESLRDLTSTIIETHLTMQGNALNEIMKKVTSWAAVIAVPTAITGFYGMNVPYPGFEKHWGFLTSVVLLVVLSLGLYGLFKKNDWL